MGVTRNKLYEEVWAEPMTTVAKRYQVSSNFLARVCERLNVPHPTRGYWAKLSFGKAPERPNLPEPRPGDALEWTRDGDPVSVPVLIPAVSVAAKRRRRPATSKRPDRHPLVVQAPQHFEGARELDTGFLKPAKKLLVDVVATKEALPHALDVANQLFLTLEDRGHRVILANSGQKLHRVSIHPNDGQQYHRPWHPHQPTVVCIDALVYGLTVYELTEEAEVEWHNGKYVRTSQLPPRTRPSWSQSYKQKRQVPSGRICVRAYSPYSLATWQREWRESSAGTFAAKFETIAKELEHEVPAIVKLLEEGRRRAEVAQKEWEEQQRKWRLEEEARRQTQATKESRDHLFQIIEKWAQARQIEGFFEDAERRSASLTEDARHSLQARLNEARELLGGIDALEHFRAWKSPRQRLSGYGRSPLDR